MYENSLFVDAKQTLEAGLGFRALFKVLPPGREIAVLLDNRIPCALVFKDPEVKLEPRNATNAEFELVLFSESIRRLRSSSPSELLSLIQEAASLSFAGHLKVKLLVSPQDLYKKGYHLSLKNLGSEVQKELSKLSFILLTHAHQTFESIKTLLKR